MMLEKETQTITTKLYKRNSLRKMSLQRQIHTLLLLAASGGALVATPQLARAEFTPNPTPPNYIASGEETTPQSLTEDNVQVVTDDDFSVETDSGTALTLSGAGAIGYNDTNESRLVSGADGYGLSITSTGDAGDIPGSVTVHTNGTIQGASGGIYTTNNGTGDTSITVTGTTIGINGSGIEATNSTTAQNLTIEADSVQSGNVGIIATNEGSGDTNITVHDSVNASFAIFANNGTNAQDLTVDIGGAADGGIQVFNSGAGQTRLAVEGAVTATGGAAIIVVGQSGTTDLTVTAGAVTSGGYGMFVGSGGQGDTVIDVEGAVTATNGHGILVSHSHHAQNLHVSVGSVSGSSNGIKVTSSGSGAIDIDVEGSASGTSGYGIDVTSIASNSLNVSVGSASGGISGIRAINDGSGDADVTVDGLASGISDYGIDALNEEGTHNLTVSAGSASGGISGIRTINDGAGDTKVTVTGAATAADTDPGTTPEADTSIAGIYAVNGTAANDLTVEAGSVSGGQYGVYADNQGTGNTSISIAGSAVNTNALSQSGIFAQNGATAQDLTINAGSVSGSYNGVAALNDGQGDTVITVEGSITATSRTGISASNGENAGNLSVSAGAVTGAYTGVDVTNEGSGDTTVTVAGAVIGNFGNGVQATNEENARNLILNVGSASGTTNGLFAINRGSGATTINATGSVSAGEQGGIGLFVRNYETTTGLTVTAGAVSGPTYGLRAINEGTGDTSVSVTGEASSETLSAIQVENGVAARNLVLNAANATGGSNAVVVQNKGTGDTTVTVTGTATATAISDTNSTGIFAYNTATARHLTVNANNASGAVYGLRAWNDGLGNTSITINGVVEGGEAGLSAQSSAGRVIEININGTVRNSSQNSADAAIVSESGVVTINNNQLLMGTVTLGDQGNSFNNAGVWDATGGTSALGGGANLLDNQAGGTILAANAQGPSTTTFTGAGTVVHSGSIVLQNREAGGATAYTGDVVTFTNGGNGDFQSNGGRLFLDADIENGTSDRLVADNVSVASGPTRVHINAVGGTAALTEEGINVVEVLGDSADGAFVLGNSVGRGLYSYELGRGLSPQTEQNWYLREGDEIRGEVPMASALSVLAGRTSLATLSSVHDRQRAGGDESDYYSRRDGARLVSLAVILPEQKQPARKGVWGRVFGQSNEFGSGGGTGAGYDTSLWGAQAGIDLMASGSVSEGRSYGGVYLGYATSRGDALRGGTRLGNLKVSATSVGAYYTRYNSNGFYWDATAQYSRISDAELKYLGDRTGSDGSSYLLSLEAGKQLNRESKYVAELQGQLLYQKTSIDEIRLADATRFDVGNLSGVTGRIGVRLARNPYQGARVQPWISANLWRTFNQDVRVSSLGESATTPAGGTTGEVQLGFSLVPQNASGWSAYLSGGYQFDVSGSEYSGWKGTVGVRKGW